MIYHAVSSAERKIRIGLDYLSARKSSILLFVRAVGSGSYNARIGNSTETAEWQRTGELWIFTTGQGNDFQSAARYRFALRGNDTDCRRTAERNKIARLPITLVPGRRANYGNAPRHVSLITREFVSSVSCSTCPPTMPAAGIMNLNLSLNITHTLLADGISAESGDRHANAQRCAMLSVCSKHFLVSHRRVDR